MPTQVDRINREHVESFMADQLDSGVDNCQSPLRRRSAVFHGAEDGEESRPVLMANIKPPYVPDAPDPVVGDDDLRKLLTSCEGKTFEQAPRYPAVGLGCSSTVEGGLAEVPGSSAHRCLTWEFHGDPGCRKGEPATGCHLGGQDLAEPSRALSTPPVTPSPAGISHRDCGSG